MPRKRGGSRQKLSSSIRSEKELAHVKDTVISHEAEVTDSMSIELEVKELRNLLMMSANKMAEIRQSVLFSQSQIQKHSEEIVKQRNINKELRDEISTCYQMQATTETVLKTLKRENDQLHAKTTGLSNELQQSSDLNKKYKSEISNLQKEKVHFEKKNEQVQRDFSLFRIKSDRKHKKEISILQERIEKMENENKRLKMKYQKLSAENETLLDKSKDAVDALSDLSAKYAIEKVVLQEENLQLHKSVDWNKKAVTAFKQKYDEEVLALKRIIAEKDLEMHKQATNMKSLKINFTNSLQKLMIDNDAIRSKNLSLKQFTDVLTKEKVNFENETCQSKERLKTFEVKMLELTESLMAMHNECLEKATTSCFRRKKQLKLEIVFEIFEKLKEAIADTQQNFN